EYSMQDWLIGQVKGLDATVMMVTHDVEEAMLVGNKIFLLSGRPVKADKGH
ncbi:ABC-type nitrate/sulfonate/bicarbonate transport system, ATPase component, partial [human gut metagenome]